MTMLSGANVLAEVLCTVWGWCVLRIGHLRENVMPVRAIYETAAGSRA